MSSWGALLLRSLDRAGKGLRAAPRDALLADSTHSDMHGLAYGFHRAMDNAGTLLAVAVLSWMHWPVGEVILWSAAPGALVVLVLVFGVREPPIQKAEHEALRAPRPAITPPWSLLSPDMRRYLWVQLLLLWATLNVCKSATSLLGGRMADAFGKRRLTIISWSGYALSFVLLGLVEHGSALWFATVLYGALIGLGKGSERALISLYADERERARRLAGIISPWV